MRQLLLPILIILGFEASSQQIKDTVFFVRNESCACRYPVDSTGDNRIFSRQQEPAYYPGGEESWKKFLKKNLDEKNFKGRHEIQVRFLVDKNGDISELVHLNSTAPAEKFNEVARVIKLSGKWFPSVQGGYCVKSYKRLMVPL